MRKSESTKLSNSIPTFKRGFMSNDELQKLAQEYNDMQEEGAAMWEDLKKYAVRMKEILKIIDEEKPGCYDEIGLLFGCKLDLDL